MPRVDRSLCSKTFGDDAFLKLILNSKILKCTLRNLLNWNNVLNFEIEKFFNSWFYERQSAKSIVMYTFFDSTNHYLSIDVRFMHKNYFIKFLRPIVKGVADLRTYFTPFSTFALVQQKLFYFETSDILKKR